MSDLKVKNLKNLITLHCYNNLLEDLNCSDLEYLEDLNCANNVSCTKHEGYSHPYLKELCEDINPNSEVITEQILKRIIK